MQVPDQPEPIGWINKWNATELHYTLSLSHKQATSLGLSHSTFLRNAWQFNPSMRCTDFHVMRSPLFWDIMRRRMVIVYRRFGKTYRSHLQGVKCRIGPIFTGQQSDSWPMKMGQIICPETSVNDYHSTLLNTPEERRSHQHRGGSLKSKL
jgi:hypothetical protein